MLEIKKISIFGVLILFFAFFALPSLAQNGENSEGTIILWLEAINFLLLLTLSIIILVLNVMVVNRFKDSIFGSFFKYMLAGVLLAWMIRIMSLLYEFDILKISDDSFVLLWHIIFYFSMSSFLLAIHKTKLIGTKKQKEFFTSKDKFLLFAFFIISLVIILTANQLDRWLSSALNFELINHTGIHHFIAFAFAGFLAADLIWLRKNFGSILKNLVPPLLIFLVLMSLNHFWELLTESWVILDLSESVIETVEQFFWLPALAALSYGFLKLIMEVKKSMHM